MSKSIKLDNNNYLDSTSVAIDHNNLYDELFYKSGDTLVTQYSMRSAGYITSSKTGLFFSIYTPKRLDNISSVSISGTVTIRHADGGYIASSVSFSSLGTVSCYIASENCISVNITLTDATTYANNSVIGIELVKGATLTFT